MYHTQGTDLDSSGTAFSTVITTALKNVKDRGMGEINAAVVIKIVINFVLILCFPLGLKAYETHQINKLEKEKTLKEKLLASTNEKLSHLENELKSYDYLQEKAKEYKKKKEFLKHLAESRLIIPRTIDLIQNKIPKTVWLEQLKLEISEEGQKVHISGKSFNEAHVNFFANSLHDVLDKNSITVETQDIKDGNSIVRVNFNLKGRM